MKENLKDELIKLGKQHPELRKDLEPILDYITSSDRDNISASRTPEKIVNSVRVTIGELETDPNFQRGNPIKAREAGFYADNLGAHSEEVSKFDPTLSQRLREHEQIIRDTVRKEGHLTVDKVHSLLQSLKGMVRTSKYSHRNQANEGLESANEISKYVKGNLTRWQADLRRVYGRGVEANIHEEGMEPNSSSHPTIILSFSSLDREGIPDLDLEIMLEMDINDPGWVKMTRSEHDWETRGRYNVKVEELHNTNWREVVDTIGKMLL